MPVSTTADEATIVTPSPSDSGNTPPKVSAPSDWKGPMYQPPSSYMPPGSGQKRRVWPWVVGILSVLLLGLIGLGVAAAIFIPRIVREAENRHSRAENVNANEKREADSNANSNSASSSSNKDSSSSEDTRAPSDTDKVLADLTDLENDWTVANINADKKKLSRILADDYVGTLVDGSKQTKADYLNTIQRDTSIKHWDFEDLKVNLNGDRASLTGIVRLTNGDNEEAYRFTDKFVWRDGRWQATSSSIAPLK